MQDITAKCSRVNFEARPNIQTTLSCLHFFSFRLSLSRFPDHVYDCSGVSCASSPLLRPPRFRLVLVPVPVPMCSSSGLHPRSRPCASPLPSPLPSYVRSLASTPVPAPAPSPSPLTSPFPTPPPFPSPFPPPDSDTAPDPVHSFPPLGSGYPLGTMRVYRNRALRTELSGTRKRHPMFAEMMTCAEWKCLL